MRLLLREAVYNSLDAVTETTWGGMIQHVYEISGEPIAWASHKGYGSKSFNPHFQEKRAAQWELKIQHSGRPLYSRAVRVDFFFHMPVPKSMPKKLQKRIADGEKVWHATRKDRSNLEKYAADCLIGTVLTDDNIIVCGETQKFYGLIPKTIILVQTIEDSLHSISDLGDQK